MNVIYPKACGIDVHKSFIVAVICDSNSIEPKYLRKRFSTFHNSLIEFRNWLLENDCQNVCMESTGKYYVPVYNALEGYISNVVVANPKWVSCVKGEKDDNKDAKWIADLFKLGIVRRSFIPPKDIRILRELTRYRFKLINMRTSEKNRFTNSLTVGNCKLDMVFSDIFGKSSSAIIDTIISQKSYSEEEILKNVNYRCKSSNEDILNSVSGVDFTDTQKQRMTIIREHIEYIDQLINNVDELINDMIAPYEGYIKLLSQIPGVNRNVAITIISEIGTNMNQFSSAKRLTAWAGLAPGCNESAGKKKSVKISKAGVYLKPALTEAAHAAVRDKENVYYANKYDKISKRRGKKRAKIAIARKILIAAYYMLSTGEVFNPSDLTKVETDEKDRIKFTKNNFIQSTKQLISLGLSTEEIILLINQQVNSTVLIN